MRYDPSVAPAPSAWLGADEGERLEAVLEAHRDGESPSPNPRLHAAIHVTVETQLAEGLEAGVRALARLTEGGLDRHEALHAIGSVAAAQISRILKREAYDVSSYAEQLDALTADSWRRSSG